MLADIARGLLGFLGADRLFRGQLDRIAEIFAGLRGNEAGSFDARIVGGYQTLPCEVRTGL